MEERFNIADIEVNFPSAIIEEGGEKRIDFEALSLALAEEVSDIKDQLNEKDYQITRIFERLERLAAMV